MSFTLYYLFFYTTVSNTYAYSKQLYQLTNKTNDYFGIEVFHCVLKNSCNPFTTIILYPQDTS